MFAQQARVGRVLAHGCHDIASDRAGMQREAAALGDLSEGIGIGRIAQQVADGPRLASRVVEVPCGGQVALQVTFSTEQAIEPRAHFKAFLRQRDRGLEKR